MANVRDLAHGTEMPVLICTGVVEGGDPARFANPEDFRKSATGPNKPVTSGTCASPCSA